KRKAPLILRTPSCTGSGPSRDTITSSTNSAIALARLASSRPVVSSVVRTPHSFRSAHRPLKLRCSSGSPPVSTTCRTPSLRSESLCRENSLKSSSLPFLRCQMSHIRQRQLQCSCTCRRRIGREVIGASAAAGVACPTCCSVNILSTAIQGLSCVRCAYWLVSESHLPRTEDRVRLRKQTLHGGAKPADHPIHPQRFQPGCHGWREPLQ